MQTFGDICDQLVTVIIKLFMNHENFYHQERLDKMNEQQLRDLLKKEIDLNLQRNALIEEMDIKLSNIVSGKEVIRFKKHKTSE